MRRCVRCQWQIALNGHIHCYGDTRWLTAQTKRQQHSRMSQSWSSFARMLCARSRALTLLYHCGKA
eukprot:scaffold346964_cov17-Prasinocladus_malaysianus.AAC.1